MLHSVEAFAFCFTSGDLSLSSDCRPIRLANCDDEHVTKTCILLQTFVEKVVTNFLFSFWDEISHCLGSLDYNNRWQLSTLGSCLHFTRTWALAWDAVFVSNLDLWPQQQQKGYRGIWNLHRVWSDQIEFASSILGTLLDMTKEKKRTGSSNISLMNRTNVDDYYHSCMLAAAAAAAALVGPRCRGIQLDHTHTQAWPESALASIYRAWSWFEFGTHTANVTPPQKPAIVWSVKKKVGYKF